MSEGLRVGRVLGLPVSGKSWNIRVQRPHHHHYNHHRHYEVASFFRWNVACHFGERN